MRRLLAFGVSTFALVAACSGAKEDGLTTGSPSSSSGNTSSSGTSGTSGNTSSGTSGTSGSSGTSGTSGSSGTSGTSGSSGGEGDFKLSAQVSRENTCAGADLSPALTWTGAPAGTKSFAAVLVDTTTSNYRWAIADIPSTLAALTPGVQKSYQPLNVPGAKQALVQQGVYGYKGPCPPKGETHSYQLTLYALDSANLPAFNQTMTAQEAETAIKKVSLANSFITAKWTTN